MGGIHIGRWLPAVIDMEMTESSTKNKKILKSTNIFTARPKSEYSFFLLTK